MLDKLVKVAGRAPMVPVYLGGILAALLAFSIRPWFSLVVVAIIAAAWAYSKRQRG